MNDDKVLTLKSSDREPERVALAFLLVLASQKLYNDYITGIVILEKASFARKHLMESKFLVLRSSLWTGAFLLSMINAPVASAVEHKLEESEEPKAITIQELAKRDAQSFTVDSNVELPALDRGSYSATTAEEVAAIQAERARVEEEARIKAEEEAKAQAAVAALKAAAKADAPKMSGTFAWPVNGYHIWDWEQNGFQTSSRPSHNGLDMLAPAMTPIYAIHDGTVIASSEASSGWGVYVQVRGVVDGQELITTYAHMTYGTRQVQVGDSVTAGTHLGGVGMTGRATANHLHLEVKINGAFVDPRSWLEKNLGPV